MAFGLTASQVGAIGVGANLAGGLLGSDAAGDAADAQGAATERANALSQQQYQQIRADNAPFLRNGTNASNKLAYLLGLGGTDGPGSASYQAIYEGQRRAAIAAGANPSDPNFERNLDIAVQSAFQGNPSAAGTNANDPEYGSLTRNFTGADLENEPGYKFGLQQGQQALDNRAAAGGSYFSGAALKGATRYAQDYAGTKYGDAFNRDASQKNQTYNFLSGTANTGLNAANMTGSAGTSMANTVGANTTALGNSVGASQIAQGNALSGSLSGAVGGYQQNQLMQAILGGNKGFGSSSGGFGGGSEPYPGYNASIGLR